MSESAAWALQKAIHQALAADAQIAVLLGGPHIHDNAPQRVIFPYVTFGQSSSRDWGTSTEDGEEHVFTIHIWSRSGSRKQAQRISEAIRAVLHAAELALEDHHLVNLRHEFADVRRDADGETMHGVIRYRAVTEPIAQFV